jgi:hypothetical protein
LDSKEWKEYLHGKSWRCPHSPNGAHHWLLDAGNKGRCKYCSATRHFVPRIFYGHTSLDTDPTMAFKAEFPHRVTSESEP